MHFLFSKSILSVNICNFLFHRSARICTSTVVVPFLFSLLVNSKIPRHCLECTQTQLYKNTLFSLILFALDPFFALRMYLLYQFLCQTKASDTTSESTMPKSSMREDEGVSFKVQLYSAYEITHL